MLRKELVTQVVIDAPPERVWSVLTDFSRYPEWNAFITRIDGEAVEGARLQIQLRLPGGGRSRFRPRICRVESARRLCWLGHLLVSGLLDGEHSFLLEPLEGGRTQFVQREQFRGLLIPLVWPSLKKRVRQGFLSMNAALKTRVEGLAARAKE